ncbi:recombinase-like zinc beta ribbon protein [Rhodovulum adriaticum]|uniref:Recombinase-like zinc beta ribbon protein n=2 Tax=Rhodovulum adriaticum TaxID=35804 RepID=A0A4R2NLN5_RHOAD|nr:recombinase-like zinc beta ribbon protein [Rhodovulum adriaticum]
MVVVDDIDRFARDVSVFTDLRKQIESAGARLESPKFEVGQDAHSSFVLKLRVLLGELEAGNNRERAQGRVRSRLEMGYWTFAAPWGYRYEKTAAHGKILVRDEPLASIIAEALNGYATGRFQSQAEVKRFLDSKREFPKDYRGKEVSVDRVSKIIKNLLYAGYLQRPERGIPLTPAFHEALITYDTYLINQHKLRQAAVAPAKKNIDRDFPLRGFLVCETCGRKLTSCWSQSHTGRRYPYYLCQYRGCPEKGKSTPRHQLEGQFEAILQSLEPSKETFDVAERMFKTAWKQQGQNAQKEARRLKQRSTQIDK